ncbi:conserved unknown protein [Ectocarpus siliculosus]|uniref:Uncharacterized protein n=1 Tax=Ectocarpus siliculosus TaxID=2880 RepID=D8LNU5_ECTSI|nr:conserved unknown protein [Ectocarpus siliculosus]|eukprot:CBN78305.1 conserved unknown protein [Ectocarpus siliculosus]
MGSDSSAKAAAGVTEAPGWKCKIAYGINLHKFLCAPIIYFFMLKYSRFSAAAWTYLALHGSYGYLWIVKDQTFPDRNFHGPTSFGEMSAAFVATSVLYWAIPWIMMHHGKDVPPWFQALAIGVFSTGMFLMIGADCQKYYTLKLAPGKLITTGFFKYIRSPNYLGELMVYGALSMLTYTAWGWIPFATLVLRFSADARNKDRSMSRYEEFAEWKASSYLLLPPVY